jgi:hypothetical protein
MKLIDIPFIILVIIAGHVIINIVSKRFKLGAGKTLLTRLFYYHLAFSIIYFFYVNANGGDSLGYWRAPVRFIHEWESPMLLHKPGSAYVHFITYPFSQLLGMSLFGGFILFTLFGFGGFICIYLTLRKTLTGNPKFLGVKLFPLILYLPNMHFWSSGIGKDAVIFFALSLFIYSLTNPKRNIPGLAFGFYLAFFVRPHIAFVMLIAFAIAIFLSSEGISVFWRVTFLVMAFGVFVAISDTVLSFIGVEEGEIENYEDIASLRSKNLSRSSVGSRIDITGYSAPMKVFTFLYRPLFLDANNIFGLVVSFENLFYLLLTLSVLFWPKSFVAAFRMPMFLKAALLIAGATSFFMSNSLSNLGIIIRQKNMVMFMVLLVLLYMQCKIQFPTPKKRSSTLVNKKTQVTLAHGSTSPN